MKTYNVILLCGNNKNELNFTDTNLETCAGYYCMAKSISNFIENEPCKVRKPQIFENFISKEHTPPDDITNVTGTTDKKYGVWLYDSVHTAFLCSFNSMFFLQGLFTAAAHFEDNYENYIDNYIFDSDGGSINIIGYKYNVSAVDYNISDPCQSGDEDDADDENITSPFNNNIDY